MSEEIKPNNSSNTTPKPGAPIRRGIPSRPVPTSGNRPPVRPNVNKNQKSTNVSPKPAVGSQTPLNKPAETKSMPTVGANVKPKATAKDVTSKDIKADENNEEKKKKRKKLLLLLLLLLLFLAAIGTAIYFIANIQTDDLNFTVQINSEVETTFVDPNDGTVKSILIVPGDNIKASMTVQVKNQDLIVQNAKKVFLRFKVEVEIDNNSFIGLFDPVLNESTPGEKWTRGDDGYYYYNFFLYGTEPKITAFNYLDFVSTRSNNALNGKNGKLVLTVEILEGNFSAISQHWYTAPTAWRRIVN